MSDLFFEQLGLPEPDVHLGVGSGTHGAQTAAVMRAIEPELLEHRPDAVIVVGDVNSTLAAALVAVKLHIPVAHVEAGLRSGDRTMPEEINRIATDAISDYCYVTEEAGREHLLREGRPMERIVFAGNVMIDSLAAIGPRAKARAYADEIGLGLERFALVTLHRPATVDSPRNLKRALEHLQTIALRFPVVLPLHPRTRQRLVDLDLTDTLERIPGLRVLPPLGYLEFASLMQSAALVFTDSGGLQEETTYLGVPCITMRPNTERPVTISEGTNVLFDIASDGLGILVDRAAEGSWKQGRIPEGWDGHAAERIASHLAGVLG